MAQLQRNPGRRRLTANTPVEDAQASWLYNQPTITLERATHLALIRRLVANPAGTALATVSDDKTLRIWSATDGALQATIRMPAGPGNAGQPLALAWSPDSRLIAVGGNLGPPRARQIVLFDATTHAMAARIQGLPGLTAALHFAPRSQTLAAGLSDGGIRLFAPPDGAGPAAGPWREIARDTRFRQRISAVGFAPDGRLAVASYDGVVVLYTGPLEGNLRASHVFDCPHPLPFDLRFDPPGERLAIGYDRELAIDILDGHTLARLPSPPMPASQGDPGDCATVAWSADGQTLYAGGTHPPSRSPTSPPHKIVLAWDARGAGPLRTLPASDTTILGIGPLPGGDLLVAGADPWLGRLGPHGEPRWRHPRMQPDFRGAARSLAVSPDGLVVDFGLERFGQVPARFDMASLTFSLTPPDDAKTRPPDQTTIRLSTWENNDAPALDDWRLPLEPHELARSFATHPDGKRFLLGADWTLTAYATDRRQLWQRQTGTMMGVNISADGHLAIGALTDGTIRWYRMDDGIELLALMPFADRTNWVAWTPDGFFASSQAAYGILRWHINHGEAAAAAVSIADIQGSYRPELLPLILAERETLRALGRAQMIDYNRRVARATGSRTAPGARLHLLAIGIGIYNQAYAAHLTLAYARADAEDFATLIATSQRSLYGDVLPQCLADADATRTGVLRAFDVMGRGIAAGSGNDLAVIHFSGHGAMIDNRLYLLLHDVDAREPVGIRAQGSLSAEELQAELQRLARYGRVLVLLDACHSGGATASGEALSFDAGLMGAMLVNDRITVITSSSRNQVSFEDPAWGHGAFTKVLLDAFTDPRADPDNDGLINATSLAHYVSTQVQALTKGRQTPSLKVQYDASIFARRM